MPRPRKNPAPSASPSSTSSLSGWAEQLGEALGRGVARGINAGLTSVSPGPGPASQALPQAPRRRGRPPKALAGGKNLCTVPGCGGEARSKGLCSRHYQSERRRQLKRGR